MIGPLPSVLASIGGVSWLAALLAVPQRPRRPDELADLVYARLVGRQQRMMAAAMGATVVAAIVRLMALV